MKRRACVSFGKASGLNFLPFWPDPVVPLGYAGNLRFHLGFNLGLSLIADSMGRGQIAFAVFSAKDQRHLVVHVPGFASGYGLLADMAKVEVLLKKCRLHFKEHYEDLVIS